jgi:hypothetical protein
MTTQFINLKRLTRDLVRIEQKLLVTEDIATTRALNQLVTDARIEIVEDISKEYGYPKNSIKRRMKPIKATRNRKNAGWFIKSARFGWAKPNQLKATGGVSHIKKGGQRTKVTTKITAKGKTGTKPFLIPATKGTYGKEKIFISGASKKIAVYRKPGFKRKTTTLQGPTVPRMLKAVGIDDKWLFRYVQKNLPDEYSKQLKKAKFRGKRG